ncbi:MAG: mandelate racemase/muconate lactonizing enzyme family protein [Planctomycetaceae bacterium]|nr:mandelate racemase/muconate lactonizing enzyme family protein [Planctomycetaceae bacterium]
MRITRIVCLACRIPLRPERRMISSLGQHVVSEYPLVRVETDAGIDGVGEATVTAVWSGETVWGAQAVIERVFAPLLVGADPTDIGDIDRRMDAAAEGNWFAKSAIEMACWDILGKDAGKPVYDLLDGLVRPAEIACRFSMGAYPPERVRNTVPDLVARGFQTIKVKVGQSIERDVERVALVRELIGPDRAIVIDANCGYSPVDAIEAARRMEPYAVGLFEQPTPRDDYEGLAEVRRNVSMPVMADDMVFTFNHARECLRHEAVDIISIYPGKCGGIRKCRNIAALAAEHGVACSIGSNLEWDVATAAMCHLVVGTPNMQVERVPGDILGPAYHEVRIATNPLNITGPVVTTPDGPGLGVEVDWAVAEKHAIA